MTNKNSTILMILSMLFWGTNWPVAKIISGLTATPVLIFWRYVFCVVVFVSIILYQRRKWNFTKKNLGVLAICVLCQLLYQICFFSGLKQNMAQIGGVLTTTLSPVIIYIIVSAMQKKKLALKEWGVLGLGIIGTIIFLSLWHYTLSTLLSSGIYIFVLTSLAWSGLSIASQYHTMDGMVFNGCMFISMLAISSISLVHYSLSEILPKDPKFWTYMLYLGVVGTAYSTGSFFWITNKKGAKYTTSFMLLVPIFAVTASAILLDEPITKFTIIGGTLMMFAAYKINQFSQQQQSS